MGSGHEDTGWPRRRRLRLRDYDYSQAGAYAVTICTHGGAFLFGHVSHGAMHVNAAGRVVERVWDGLPEHYSHLELDVFVVMPDHVHGVIVLADEPLPAELEFSPAPRGVSVESRPEDGRAHDEAHDRKTGGSQTHPYARRGRGTGRRVGQRPTPTKDGGSRVKHGLSEIVRGFKSYSAQQVNELRGTTGVSVWQRGFYEHVVRNEEDLNRIREYIVGNPLRWWLRREDQVGG